MLSGHTMINGNELDLVQLLSITIPGAICGVLVIGFWSMFRGKDLEEDEEFQEKIKDPETKKYNLR